MRTPICIQCALLSQHPARTLLHPARTPGFRGQGFGTGKALGFLGFKGWGFRGLGFRDLGLRGLGLV